MSIVKINIPDFTQIQTNAFNTCAEVMKYKEYLSTHLNKDIKVNSTVFTNKEYKFICEILWGCVPIDKDWAMQTPIFQNKWYKILKQYPKLDINI